MVLTDRQRADLHAGIHEYLLSRPGEEFALAAKAMFDADPKACERNANKTQAGGDNNANAATTPTTITTSGIGSKNVPLLEKKWTAVPRLQKKVLELERALASAGPRGTGGGPGGAAGPGGRTRRMLPRPPCTFTLSGHSSVVNAVTVHPTYTLCASASDDGTVKLWDYESGEFVKTLRGHTAAVNSVQFDGTTVGGGSGGGDKSGQGGGGGGGKLLVSCGSDLCIKIWHEDGGQWTCRRTLRGHDHTISAVAFIPRGKLSGGIGGGGGQPTKDGEGTSSTGGASHLVSASRDETVKIWEVESGFCVHTYPISGGHRDWVRCLAVKHDGTMIASGGNDSMIVLWGNDPELTGELDHDGKRKKLGELRGHSHVVESVAFALAPHGTGGAGGTSSMNGGGSGGGTSSSTANKPPHNPDHVLVSGGRDRTVKLWNVRSLDCLMTFTAHENWVRSVLLHPSGLYVLSAGDDRTIRVLDIKSNRCLRTIDNAHGHFVTSMSIHPTLPILVSGGVDHTVKCWTLE